ncbi:hypothetical protein BH23PLA1_BH23PLA1_13270 [soil metagenome]
MSRPSTRRLPNLERLETREVLSSGVIDGELQYMLELVNLARTNPPEAAERIERELSDSTRRALNHFGEDLQGALGQIASAQPRDPVAWNDQLGNTAQRHSQDLADNQIQSHNGSDGSTLRQRLDRAGYSNYQNVSENVFSYSESVDHAMEAFLLDWNQDSNPHRNTIQQHDPGRASFNEVGLGIANWTQESRNPFLGADDRGPTETRRVVTQVFARRDQGGAQLLGVVYNDLDGDDFYSVGEGRGGVTIEITDLDSGQTRRVSTTASGGYQTPLSPGRYDVVARLGSQVVGRETNVRIGTANVKLDFDLSKAPPAETSASTTSATSGNSTTGLTVTSQVALASSSTQGNTIAHTSSGSTSPARTASTTAPVTVAPASVTVTSTPATVAVRTDPAPTTAPTAAPTRLTQLTAEEPARETQTQTISEEGTETTANTNTNSESLATSNANTTTSGRTSNQTSAEPFARLRTMMARRVLQDVLQGIEWNSPRKRFQVWMS